MLTTVDLSSPSSLNQSSHSSSSSSVQGIKQLIDSGLQHVPPNYIRLPHERPCLSQDRQHIHRIPLIDLSGLHDQRRSSIIEEIGDACVVSGFFQVINHGVPQAVREGMWKASHQFFNMPAEERMRFYSEDFRDPVRYVAGFYRPNETVLEWKDSLFLTRTPGTPTDGTLKQAPVFLREPSIQFLNETRALAGNMCNAIFESLGMDTDAVEKELPIISREVMAINYYPPCPEPTLTFGIGGHTDINMLTILMQDKVPGLQVLKGGEWMTVEPVPDSLVVIVSDQIQILTNGRYKSVKHRAVTNSERPRISIPCFFSPAVEASIAPLARFVNDDNPALYKAIRYGDYLKNFYGKGLNIKTDHNLLK